MANNTRYQPVQSRDSFEEQGYSQAPPSYQAEPALGQARSEDDNVPDDFKFGGSVAEATLPIRMQFIRKVYSILTVQLLFTTALSAVSFFSASYKSWIQSNQWMMWVSLFGAIGFMLLTFWKRKSYPTNLVFLAGFTGLEAYAISVITSFYDSKIVLQALIFTLGIFIALTLFACQSKYDFTSWMPYLFGALWILIIFGFMAAFFPYSSGVELGYGIVAALIFSGYILVDTQLVMRHYHVEEEIAAAISLYLDERFPEQMRKMPVFIFPKVGNRWFVATMLVASPLDLQRMGCSEFDYWFYWVTNWVRLCFVATMLRVAKMAEEEVTPVVVRKGPSETEKSHVERVEDTCLRNRSRSDAIVKY